MNLNFQEHLPTNFSDSSRAWIYQSSRLFLVSEAFELDELLQQFIGGWKSHGDNVKGYANLFFGQFIVLMADETATGVGGCSTDSSVHFIKSIEKKFNVQLLNRLNLAFIVKDKIQILPMGQLDYAVDNNFINSETLYFNNTVLNKRELQENWIIPVKNSWLAKKLLLKI